MTTARSDRKSAGVGEIRSLVGYRQRRGLLLRMCLIAALAAAALLTWTELTLRTVRIGYEVMRLEERLEGAREEHYRLLSQRSRQVRLEEVERRARHELGFRDPVPGQVLILPAAGAVSEGAP